MEHKPPGSQERDFIKKEEFERKGQEWTVLDSEYDTLFQHFVDNPRTMKPEEIAEMRNMQKRLFELETELLLVASGEKSIQG